MADLLRMDYIRSLEPLMVSMGVNDTFYDLETLCVQTGLLRYDVCGKLDRGHIAEVYQFKDWDGNTYEPDEFYTDYKEQS